MENVNSDGTVVLGKFGSGYGIRGWIRVISFTEVPSQIFEYQPWYIKKNGSLEPVVLTSWKSHSDGFVAKIQQYDDRDAVAALTNYEIEVDVSQFPLLDEGDFYWKDLIGCRVVTAKGYDLGRVVTLMETGSNDVLVVKANINDAFGAAEHLVPFLYQHTVKRVDLLTNTIEVDWDPSF